MGNAQASAETDRLYMNKAIALAMKAAGQTAPNPVVGCVLVRDGEIIGEGWHKGPGLPHAEVEAIAAAGGDASGAVAYVTLEPCNHTGRTGPCAEALIAAGVEEVVYAMADPNPVAAGGAGKLGEAGVKVRGGVCEDAAKAMNRPWLHALHYKRPFVTGKTAMSIDARTATSAGESQWITSPSSRNTGHQMRWRTDAIIVGAGTVIADDPALTARPAPGTLFGKPIYDGERYPLRVVVDSTARTSPGAKAFERTGKGAILATTKRAPESRLSAFREMGVEILVLPRDEKDRVDLDALLDALYERDVHAAMIEGGGDLLGGFFDADLLDEIVFFIAPKVIGGGKPALAGDGVARLADAERFEFSSAEGNGPDLIWSGLRRRTD